MDSIKFEKNVLIGAILSFLFLVGIRIHSYFYKFIGEGINTVIGAFREILTIPVILFIFFALVFGIVKLFKKGFSRIVVLIILIACLSITCMFLFE